MPEVAIIVPLHRQTAEARECIERIDAVRDHRAELIVVSDLPVEGLPPAVRIVETGAARDTSPAEKRDAALAQTDAPLCAFIDDDAYPAEDWLELALRRFAEDPTLDALGGPGLTPPHSPFRRRLAGAFYESRLGSGGLRSRFVQCQPLGDVDDWPAYNLFVRSSALRAVGGWASRYYGGEDTKLCLELRDHGYRIGYDPTVVVYHHRRPVFGPLMRQTANVGRRRGSFVRRYPETSRRAVYFAPAVALLVGPTFSILAVRRWGWSRVSAAAALMWGAISALTRHDGARMDEALALPLVLVAGHTAYGCAFLRGLFGSHPTGELGS